MAPKRRTASSRPVAANQQSKLSFTNKVTKQGSKQQSKGTKEDPALVEHIVRTDVKAEGDPDIEEPTTAEKAIQQQAEDEAASLDAAQDALEADGEAVTAEDVLGGRAEQSDIGAVGGKASGWVGDEEEKARKTTDTQIKKYWRTKEQERLAPRVHQEDLTLYEKVLREWDMSGQYGPCIGIARLKRWKRANMLGLHPPIEVLAVLLKQMDAGDTNSQRAHVDELMSSRFVADN
ncbi:uncharacterized protein LTR77_009311 [Saxophila tyrrhenica]|uniref:DNA polymerase delta subunit 4 n=1 Tax=Saxophila tyrrhenica TaxID=1690608 RepID=A0AAV9P2U6_9PEZI|nr:hypothetical protein LTR77_009311 [Saxophila tyrrhenica]